MHAFFGERIVFPFNDLKASNLNFTLPRLCFYIVCIMPEYGEQYMNIHITYN